ncbi:efflux transporter outer membrane subunit [Sphingomonas kyeonggiensis]|uniref:NodT family efflux transporter outer membrane factor (OMF) lipoprotein n=1 Tax=Sphingomonas kyeonggiensis TaxID=1268553 RepID=A0A7W6JZ80_9SPHN|nr:TolC family protein [Sphingomonas kyeonggiensis]MBB4101162.1 NodT family efflux transporter outer membrane factor (OMF) lipoprotein [Sphingomonas kyeonggiensis]
MTRRLSPLLALAAAACATPGARPPATTPPPGIEAGFAPLPSASIAPVPDQWWRLFDDPELDRLVAASLAANADLRVAYANLDAARAALRQARAQRLPQATIESSLTLDDPANQPSAATVSSSDYDIAATINWDADLFGRLRAGALAARADAAAAEAAADGVRVAVVADTVLAYVDLCGAHRAEAVSREIVAAQTRSVEMLRDQLRAGEISPLEVSQAENMRATAEASVPGFTAQRSNALYRLATLQGLAPAAARGWNLSCTAVPHLSGTAPVGDGTALLLRRPDIREAERKLAAAAARVGVARAELYPKVNLGGALGLLRGDFSAALSPLVSWALPNVPGRAKLAQARATEAGTLASWDVAVLRALREVETALAEMDGEVRRNRALADAEQAGALYAKRSAARVRLGDAAPLLRIDAERSLATARLERARSDLLVARNQVLLFRALGGGWQASPAEGQ